MYIKCPHSKYIFACSSTCFCILWFVSIKVHALTLASVSGADLINHRIPLPLKKHFPQKKCRRLHDLSTEAVHKRANSTNDWTVSYLIVHTISFPLFHWTFREISQTVRREPIPSDLWALTHATAFAWNRLLLFLHNVPAPSSTFTSFSSHSCGPFLYLTIHGSYPPHLHWGRPYVLPSILYFLFNIMDFITCTYSFTGLKLSP